MKKTMMIGMGVLLILSACAPRQDLVLTDAQLANIPKPGQGWKIDFESNYGGVVSPMTVTLIKDTDLVTDNYHGRADILFNTEIQYFGLAYRVDQWLGTFRRWYPDIDRAVYCYVPQMNTQELNVPQKGFALWTTGVGAAEYRPGGAYQSCTATRLN